MITEETIRNFFEGKCDARDAALVQTWLEENPAKFKEYIAEKEWDDFQPTHILSPDRSRKIWNNIKNTTSPANFSWLAVAASVLLIVGLSWLFIQKKPHTATVATTKNVLNVTPQKKTLKLSDGSTIELLPNSKLSYPEKFDALKREVLLNGEANFTIAKDAASRFSVHTHSILITVLGTRFTVNAYEANQVTKVILQEGRIMIKIPDSQREYYLAPEDVFIYKNDSARIFPLEKEKDDYVFNNYPLDVVFDQLQLIYNTRIIYNKAALGNRTFIGKIDKKDSLYHILQSIALLNNFGLHKQGDSFSIGN